MLAALLGLMFATYKAPHRAYWLALTGGLLVASAIGFMGYVLPIGQLSFWAAANGLPTVPSLAPVIPVAVLALFALHVSQVYRAQKGTASAHRYSASGLLAATTLALVVGAYTLMTWRTLHLMDAQFPAQLGSSPTNRTTLPANPLSVPAHILPEWKFLPMYAVLRALPVKELGVATAFASLGVWLLLPWLDRGSAAPAAFWTRACLRWTVPAILLCILPLAGLGTSPATLENALTAQFITAIYFSLFLAGSPWATSAGHSGTS